MSPDADPTPSADPVIIISDSDDARPADAPRSPVESPAEPAAPETAPDASERAPAPARAEPPAAPAKRPLAAPEPQPPARESPPSPKRPRLTGQPAPPVARGKHPADAPPTPSVAPDTAGSGPAPAPGVVSVERMAADGDSPPAAQHEKAESAVSKPRGETVAKSDHTAAVPDASQDTRAAASAPEALGADAAPKPALPDPPTGKDVLRPSTKVHTPEPNASAQPDEKPKSEVLPPRILDPSKEDESAPVRDDDEITPKSKPDDNPRKPADVENDAPQSDKPNAQLRSSEDVKDLASGKPPKENGTPEKLSSQKGPGEKPSSSKSPGEQGGEPSEDPASDDEDAPLDLAKMSNFEYAQVAKLNPVQLRRYEQYRRSDLKNMKVKKVLIALNPILAKASEQYVIAVKGLAKLFVGDVVEAANQVKSEMGEKGALQPKHLREAYRRLRRAGAVPNVWNRESSLH